MGVVADFVRKCFREDEDRSLGGMGPRKKEEGMSIDNYSTC